MAPPPPPSDKKPRLMSASEAQDPETISLLMMFDDLVRNEKVMIEFDGFILFNFHILILDSELWYK